MPQKFYGPQNKQRRHLNSAQHSRLAYLDNLHHFAYIVQNSGFLSLKNTVKTTFFFKLIKQPEKPQLQAQKNFRELSL